MAGLTSASKPAVANDLGYCRFEMKNPGKIAGLSVKIYIFNGIWHIFLEVFQKLFLAAAKIARALITF